MSAASPKLTTITCSCGNVHFEAKDKPIASLVCYCDDCLAGSAQLAELPGTVPVHDADGGTGYVLYRKDRFVCTRGQDALSDYRLTASSATSRVVATCCNTAMTMRFDDSRHWTSVYRERFGVNAPTLQWRICTKNARESMTLSNDVPSFNTYPMAFIKRLILSGLAYQFRSRRKLQ